MINYNKINLQCTARVIIYNEAQLSSAQLISSNFLQNLRI